MASVHVITRRYSFQLVCEPEPVYPIGSNVASPREAVAIAQHAIGDEITECVIAIFLNARHAVSGFTEIARGTLNAARFRPRDVLVPALHANAAAIIICHAHPSGEPTASRADRVVTIAMREAARLVGIPLLDHIIVAGGRYFSFRDSEGWDAEDSE